ncbi:MAG: hypothetical protein WEF50_12545 [Myxococcota bacterium]
MNTTRLTVLAIILSAFLVERTFAGDFDAADALASASAVAHCDVPVEAMGRP